MQRRRPGPDAVGGRADRFGGPANHDGLESAKPDLQSMLKKPGGATVEPSTRETLRTGMSKSGVRCRKSGLDQTALLVRSRSQGCDSLASKVILRRRFDPTRR
jgi:hypothetical protein